jgi:DNA repair protein RadC
MRSKRFKNYDLTMTKRLIEAGKILGIEVLDHIINKQKWIF